MVPSAEVSRPDPDKAGPYHHTDTPVLMPAAMMFFCSNAVIVLSCQLALAMLHAVLRCRKRRGEKQLHSSPLFQHLKAPWNDFVSLFMLVDDGFASHLLLHFVRWMHDFLLFEIFYPTWHCHIGTEWVKFFLDQAWLWLVNLNKDIW